MADSNKKSLSYKLQKNPILLVLGIVAIAVALFVVVKVSSVIKENIDTKKETETTTSTTVESTVSETDVAAEELKNVTIYNKDIQSYTVEKSENSVSLILKFKGKESLLNTHNTSDANNTDYIPLFCFYNADGTQFKCPGKLKLDTKKETATYTLSEISDFANVFALTDEETVTYDNILDLPFDVCLMSKSRSELGATLLGTYARTTGTLYPDYTIELINAAQGVKKAELVKTDEFVWLDIYYDDYASYSQLNNDFINNFVSFTVDYNGATHKTDFIKAIEYDSLNMVRCKFDSYAMPELAKAMGNSNLTVKDLFTDYNVTIRTSNGDVEQTLFHINGVAVNNETSEEAQ